MNLSARAIAGVALGCAAGCSDPVSTPAPPGDGSANAPYIVLDQTGSQLRADFNARADQIRLLFVSGPTCGICLRGLDDLDEALVSAAQNDPRLHTYVVHVPTMGAEEKHVSPAMKLMNGPRVTHYWDPSGHIGVELQDALGIDIYAWDVWLLYAPHVVWESSAPAPQFWMHQLRSLDPAKKLDARVFADEVERRLAAMPAVALAERTADDSDAGLIPVAQPRGFMIEQHILSRGGYRRLKSIESIRFAGTTEAAGVLQPVSVEMRRQHGYRRAVGQGEGQAIVDWSGDPEHSSLTELPGWTAAFRDAYLVSFDIDGWMVDWKDKHHQVQRLGMIKRGGELPWLMRVELDTGQTWHVYIDSHTGDALRKALVVGAEETFAVEFSDFREANGFRLPHRISYFDGDRLLAIDRYQSAEVTSAAASSTVAGD